MTVDGRLCLPQVTLCAVTSVNVRATLRALEASLDQVAVADCILFTDAVVSPPRPEIRIVPVARIGLASAYSQFLLIDLVEHVATSYCLIAQWDGHVLDARRWRPEFLDYDYVGASWPHFDDGHDVGNGGFSLRSRRLMEACREPGFTPSHPEDVAIGRSNRDWLEERGIRFAPRELADVFSSEWAADPQACFGYHGVWHMPQAIGPQAFWEVYRGLDDRSTLRHNFRPLLHDVRRGPWGALHAVRMLWDRYGPLRY